MKELRTKLDESLAKGWKMSKKLSSASYGLFNYSDATYDRRTVYSREDVSRLSFEGFVLDEDTGHIAFSILWSL